MECIVSASSTSHDKDLSRDHGQGPRRVASRSAYRQGVAERKGLERSLGIGRVKTWRLSAQSVRASSPILEELEARTERAGLTILPGLARARAQQTPAPKEGRSLAIVMPKPTFYTAV